jgi:hypothetical protein
MIHVLYKLSLIILSVLNDWKCNEGFWNPIVAPRKKANDSIQRRGIRNPDTPHI